MVETKFLLSHLKECLKLRVSQVGDRNNEAASVLTNIHCKVTFGHVLWKAILSIALLLSQT